MFTKDTIDEVIEIKHQLEKTQDETLNRERKLRQQASNIKELQSQLAIIERKKEAILRQEKKLKSQVKGNREPKGNDQIQTLTTQQLQM